VLGYWTTSEHQNLTCSGTGDAVRFVNSFCYDFTSRHYNLYLQCALFTSVLTLYLGWSSDCWLLGCCSDTLTLRLWEIPLISSDRVLWSPLICAWYCVSGFIFLGFYALPPWNRVLAPRIEDILPKGYFPSSAQRWLVLLGIQQFGLCSL
jgi:hypothetical protein